MENITDVFGDMTKKIQQFKVPGIDMAPILESRRKDVQAVIEANQSAYAAMQALAHKQTEILTETIQGIQHAAKGLASGGAPNTANQAEYVGNAYKKALADTKELAELVRKSQTDAMAIISARATESLQEIKKLMQPA